MPRRIGYVVSVSETGKETMTRSCFPIFVINIDTTTFCNFHGLEIAGQLVIASLMGLAHLPLLITVTGPNRHKPEAQPI
jgi:hypothetical protein